MLVILNQVWHFRQAHVKLPAGRANNVESYVSRRESAVRTQLGLRGVASRELPSTNTVSWERKLKDSGVFWEWLDEWQWGKWAFKTVMHMPCHISIGIFKSVIVIVVVIGIEVERNKSTKHPPTLLAKTTWTSFLLPLVQWHVSRTLVAC